MGTPPTPTGARDELGERFAASFTANFDDLAACYPEIARLDLVPVHWTRGRTAEMAAEASYPVGRHSTTGSIGTTWNAARRPTPYPVLSSEERMARGDQAAWMTIEGGVELSTLVLELKDGSATAFRDVVIRARPSGSPLTWDVPLDGLDDLVRSDNSTAAVEARSRRPGSANAGMLRSLASTAAVELSERTRSSSLSSGTSHVSGLPEGLARMTTSRNAVAEPSFSSRTRVLSSTPPSMVILAAWSPRAIRSSPERTG